MFWFNLIFIKRDREIYFDPLQHKLSKYPGRECAKKRKIISLKAMHQKYQFLNGRDHYES